jgi:hypothetical protein
VTFATPRLVWLAAALPFAVLALLGLELVLSHARLRRLP